VRGAGSGAGRAHRRGAEDGAIRDVVAMQEAAGLAAVTDGEFGRAFWHVDIYIRRVEKVGGRLLNAEFYKVENVKDPV
jgi:methionine synthase II (cobalamin-independent)